LRDFSLDLKGKTSKEYFEKILSNMVGDSPDIQRKNLIRERLRTYFSKR